MTEGLTAEAGRYEDVLEYDEETHRLIVTNRLSVDPDEYGASQIVAWDVEPSWGHHLVQLARQLLAAQERVAALEHDWAEMNRREVARSRYAAFDEPIPPIKPLLAEHTETPG